MTPKSAKPSTRIKGPPSLLDKKQVAFLRQEGYTSLPRLIDPPALAALSDIYDRFLRREISAGKDDRQLGGVTRQVMHPRTYAPVLMEHPAVQAGLAIARQVLAVSDLEVCFDMLIYKPPGHPKATPWHQDHAYSAMPFARAGSLADTSGLQFWVALDDVDFANGCMHFIGGLHHQGIAQHYVYAGDPADEGRLLATPAFGNPDQPNRGVPCPLPAGGCTIHYYGTPHYTPPNTTADRGRRAYIFNVRPPRVEKRG